MAGDVKEISGPLDVTRSNLYEIRNAIRAICDSLGVPPPQEASGNPVAAEALTVMDRLYDAQDQSKSALSRLRDIHDFISKI